MDFAWSEEQAAFRKEVLRFAKEELKDDVITRDHNEEFSKALWKKCAKFGIQGLPIPMEYGGGGADTLNHGLRTRSSGLWMRRQRTAVFDQRAYVEFRNSDLEFWKRRRRRRNICPAW